MPNDGAVVVVMVVMIIILLIIVIVIMMMMEIVVMITIMVLSISTVALVFLEVQWISKEKEKNCPKVPQMIFKSRSLTSLPCQSENWYVYNVHCYTLTICIHSTQLIYCLQVMYM